MNAKRHPAFWKGQRARRGMSLTCGYHCTAKPVSFGKGQSAVHTAAYNARQQLYQQLEGRSTRNYSGHDGEVLFSGIFAPKDAPDWVHDRQELWNRAEAAERQKANGQPARNMIVAFPHELDQRQREWMLKDFGREDFARHGMIADVSMHAPDEHGDQRNYHAHILVTMRRLDGDQFAKTKCREWNNKAQLEAWREGWAEKGAHALHRAGYPVEAERWRQGHRTLGEQRSAAIERGDLAFADSLRDREATMHKGPKISGMERKGQDGSDRLDALKGIIERNELRFEIKGLEAELQGLAIEQQRIKALEGARGFAGMSAAELKSWEMLAKDEAALKTDWAQDFAARARDGAQEVRQERREASFWEQQTVWWASVANQHSPETPKPAEVAEKGLQVVDKTTGAVSKLGDFVTNILAGAPPQPKEAKADMKAFVTDPAARKAQQLGRLAAVRQAQTEEQALKQMAEDIKAGRNLKAEDIQNLSRQSQEQIRAFGDDAVKQMVEGAQKRAERHWRGTERERD